MSAEYTGDAHVDRLLEWASNPKFRADRIRYVKMKTMGRKAVKLIFLKVSCRKTFSSRRMGLSAWFSSIGPYTMQSSSCCATSVSRAGSTRSLRRCTRLDTSASMGPSTAGRCTKSARAMQAETFLPFPYF
jgi:hypothetical protein